MSSLQEISYNVDANAISGTQEVPDLHVIDSKMFDGYVYPHTHTHTQHIYIYIYIIYEEEKER